MGMIKLASWNNLSISFRFVIVSVTFFSFLQVMDFLLNQGSGIYFLPLNLILILIFFRMAVLQNRFSYGTVGHFLVRALPLLAYAYCYELAGSVVHLVFKGWFDSRIAELDRLIFGFQPNLLIAGCYNWWLSEIMFFAYIIYLPLVVLLYYLIYLQKSSEFIEEYLLTLGLAYMICFIIFVVFPVASPRFYFSGLQPNSGLLFRKLMNIAGSTVQYAGGSFPSAHCAAGTVMIFFAGKLGKKYLSFYLPLVSLFFLSTVYGQYHYVADVLAGVMVGMASVKIMDRVKNRLALQSATGTGETLISR